MSGILYVVATPIGNLEDITFRAVKVLQEADVILAEDTRITKKLLDRYDIKKPLLSYHQHSPESKKIQILGYLGESKNLALVTDAGTPGISDPGNELIDFLLDQDVNTNIVPIPGASAVTSALSVSGFRTNHFVFLGFLPKKKRLKLIKWLKDSEITFSFYESPFRISKTLEYLEEQFGKDKRVLVARELTKMYESLYRGSISEVKDLLKGQKVKGEIVVVVEG